MFDATGQRFPAQGEQRLLLAVLKNAVTTFEHCLVATDARGRRLFREVERWFASNDSDWTFSFASICDALGFDVTYLRTGLRRWKDRSLVSIERGPTVHQLPVRRTNGMRHRTSARAQAMSQNG